MPKLTHELIAFMQGVDTIDCHEHLMPESARLGFPVDALTLVSLYAYVDMTSAGRPVRAGENLFFQNLAIDFSIPLEERWKQFAPYLGRIKYGSYYRPTAIALRDLFGIDDLNDQTYLEVTERLRHANTKGLYTRLLRGKCNIRTCLVQNGMIEGQDPADLLTPLFVTMPYIGIGNFDTVRQLHQADGSEASDLDAYVDVLVRTIERARAHGAVGMKMSSTTLPPPNMDAAREEFAKVERGGRPDPVLEATLQDVLFKKAAQWDFPIAIHCGVWGDFRTVDPKNMIDRIAQNPDVRFDLYHLGMPFVRDCIFVAKSFPNAYLNLCWCYVVSQEMTRRAINEIIDCVPINKVFGFGGDYVRAVENVYGHLTMARETMAEALAERIDRGQLDLEGAQRIARMWLHDNPIEFYGL